MAPPSTWYFPTEDDNYVVACDYNAAEGRYNLNCRTMHVNDIPKRVKTEMKRVATAIRKYPLLTPA
jgi:hypothetical protein